MTEDYRSFLDCSYRDAAQKQRDLLERLAGAVEAGMILSDGEREFIACVLRSAAARTPLERKKTRGGQSAFDPAMMALEFAVMTGPRGMSKTSAQTELAERYDVTLEAVRQALQKREQQVRRWSSLLERATVYRPGAK